MQTKQKDPLREEQSEEEDRQTASLAALAVILLLMIVGLMLVRVLHAKSDVEDCLLANRTNCGSVATGRP